MTYSVFFSRPMITPPGDRLTFHTVARARATRIRKTPGPTLWLRQVLIGDPVLALPGLAVDHRDAVRGRPGPHPAGEPARQPHQVRVIQLRVRIAVPAPPPGPEPARAMAQRVVRVQHDPVHAVVRAGQQVPVPSGEVIGHAPTVKVTRTSRQDISRTAPQGPLLPGEVPGGA